MPLFDAIPPKPINYTNPIAAKIQQRRLQMLVHAYCYYELDSPRIEDSTWDKRAKELHHLQQEHPDIARKVKYAKEFANFDPSTGFDLPYNTEDIKNRVERLLRYDKRRASA